MKQLIALAAAATGLIHSSAFGADLPITKAPAAIVAATWSGPYAGLGLGTHTTDVDGSVLSGTSNGANIIGCLGGCVSGVPFNGTAFRVSPYVGFNWQFAPNWVAGVEADFGWADRTVTRNGMLYPGGGSLIYLTGRGDDAFSVRTTWDASVRGRLGLLVAPTVLLYATGGVAWQHVETTSTCGSVSCPAGGFAPGVIAHTRNPIGWTAGGGFETMLRGQWIARAEYRYADFGTLTHTDTRTIPGVVQVSSYAVDLKTHTATLGLAYKLGATRNDARAAYAMAADTAPAARQWSGFYLGAGLGALASDVKGSVLSGTNNGAPIVTPTCLGGCIADESLNGLAFRTSVYAGYNWQFAPLWLAGLEADAGWADKETKLTGVLYPGGGNPFYLTGRPEDAFSIRTTWDASLRARLGVLVEPDVLLYATGGAAWQQFDTTSTCGPSFSCFDFRPRNITHGHVKTGWTAGGGFERMMWRNWIARGEYRYADFGTVTDTDTRAIPGVTQVATYSTAVKTHMATLGLAYRFNGR